MQLYKDTFDRFKNDHPDFSGAKIIYAPVRRVDNVTVAKYVSLASQLKVVHYPAIQFHLDFHLFVLSLPLSRTTAFSSFN